MVIKLDDDPNFFQGTDLAEIIWALKSSDTIYGGGGDDKILLGGGGVGD